MRKCMYIYSYFSVKTTDLHSVSGWSGGGGGGGGGGYKSVTDKEGCSGPNDGLHN